MSNQPEWRLLANLGDVNPIDYGGVFVYEDTTGVYPPEMEILKEEGEDEDGNPTKWTVSRLILERCTLANGVLSDNAYHPEHAAWFAKHLESVASSIGDSASNIANRLCSEDVLTRAHSYRDLVGHFGAYEFDQEPLEFTDRSKVEARYASEKTETPTPYAPTFIVHEWSTGFSVEHVATGKSQWMSDCVDCDFGTEDSPLTVGMPGFRAAIEKQFNSDPGEILEAYFPELADEEA